MPDKGAAIPQAVNLILDPDVPPGVFWGLDESLRDAMYQRDPDGRLVNEFGHVCGEARVGGGPAPLVALGVAPPAAEDRFVGTVFTITALDVSGTPIALLDQDSFYLRGEDGVLRDRRGFWYSLASGLRCVDERVRKEPCEPRVEPFHSARILADILRDDDL